MLKHIQSFIVHYAAMAAGICAVIAHTDPTALGSQGAAVVGAAATGVALANALGLSPVQIAKSAATVLVAGFLLTSVQGCVTTQAEQMGLATITDAAVVAVVQKGHPDNATMLARAQKIKGIATELQAVNSATVQSLPAVIQAVGPLIAAAGLNPAEALLAQQLVAALSMQLQAQLGANPQAAQVQTTVGTLLQDVIAACTAYGA